MGLDWKRTVVAGLAVVGTALSSMACSSADDVAVVAESAQTTEGEASLYRPGNRFAGWGGTGDEYLDEIQPILAERCVTCHGCTTSPCQMKLTSYEGVMRGANAHNVFKNTLLASSTGPTRMKDATTEAEWREKGFFSVTSGGKQSILYQLLEHGKDNEAGFDLREPYALYDGKASELDFQCVDRKGLASRVQKPGTGMPFGLSAIPDAEYAKLLSWVERGAPGPSAEAQKMLATPRDHATVAKWEAFFNQDSPKARLAMRYLYEHLYYARLHIDDSTEGRGDYFELVRSKTKSGPIVERVTEVPGDDPGGDFTYRLKKHTEIITAKDAVIMHLDDTTRERWGELLLDGKVNERTTIPWDVARAPGYTTRNPFAYFEAIPGRVRAELMNEMSGALIEAMVKADVCNGSAATFAIRDRFGAMFLDPDSDPSAIDPKLGLSDWSHLDPTSSSKLSDQRFARAFEAGLKKVRPRGLGVEDLWDGQGSLEKKDRNAFITVFRHGKSASAHRGPIGQMPETMWVVDYGNFERLYYDLVALYRPWAALPHKLGTWRTMSHIRAHGEDTFLLFLPEKLRDGVRHQFTPGALGAFDTVMNGDGIPSPLDGQIDETRPVEDLLSRARKHLGPEIAGFTALDPDPMSAPPSATGSLASEKDLDAALFGLTVDRGRVTEAFPDITWVTIEDGSAKKMTYTILANRVYWSNSRIIGDVFGVNRRPELDTLQVIRGRVGAFPELFLRIPASDLPGLVKKMRDPAARPAIRSTYEVRRNTPAFWSFLDEEHARAVTERPLDAAIVDTSEYLWPKNLQGTKEPLKNASFPQDAE
ncbi:MAG: fatty acid cis/trans isomerase [Labilithrix sp.]